MERAHLMRLVALLFAFALVAAACGDDDEGGGGSSTSESGETAAAGECGDGSIE